MQTQPQPFVVPVIINQQTHSGNRAEYSDSMAGVNPNQLRDLVQQAVSNQLQIHQMRNEAAMGQSMATAKSYDSNRTTQTMRDEELKLRCEQQLLNKQIPINMHPQMVQNLNLGGPG